MITATVQAASRLRLPSLGPAAPWALSGGTKILAKAQAMLGQCHLGHNHNGLLGLRLTCAGGTSVLPQLPSLCDPQGPQGVP